MIYVLIGMAGLAGLYGLHRLALWLEGRGWLYYRQKHRAGGTLQNALLNVQSMVDPSAEHLLEERRREGAEGQESGEPPEAGGRRTPLESGRPRLPYPGRPPDADT